MTCQSAEQVQRSRYVEQLSTSYDVDMVVGLRISAEIVVVVIGCVFVVSVSVVNLLIAHVCVCNGSTSHPLAHP